MSALCCRAAVSSRLSSVTGRHPAAARSRFTRSSTCWAGVGSSGGRLLVGALVVLGVGLVVDGVVVAGDVSGALLGGAVVGVRDSAVAGGAVLLGPAGRGKASAGSPDGSPGWAYPARAGKGAPEARKRPPAPAAPT